RGPARSRGLFEVLLQALSNGALSREHRVGMATAAVCERSVRSFRHQLLLGGQSGSPTSRGNLLAESKGRNRTLFDHTRGSLGEKMSLKVSALLVNPACRAG